MSIGLVSEDNRLYYAEFPFEPTKASDWVQKNVIPQLKGPPWVKPSRMVKEDILKFVTGPEKPEFWAYYGSYDWVAFCQIFGRMIDLPKHFPKYCRDLKQLCDDLGNPKLPAQETGDHNALEDAKWNRRVWKFLDDLKEGELMEVIAWCSCGARLLDPVKSEDREKAMQGFRAIHNSEECKPCDASTARKARALKK